MYPIPWYVRIIYSKIVYPAHLDIPVQVPELLHVGKGFDTSPAVVGEEVYWTHDIGDGREPQQEVQLHWINLFVHEQHLWGGGREESTERVERYVVNVATYNV